MTVRYPKRTIADRIYRTIAQDIKTDIKHDDDTKQLTNDTQPISIDQLLPMIFEQVGARHAGILYPEELLRLHADLDKLAYSNLEDDERAEIMSRLPPTISTAEALADQLLQSFVSNKIKTTGIHNYYNEIQAALSESAKLMLYYRCAIACFGDYKPDKIEIFVSKEMNANDFFPGNSRINITDITGEQISVVNYQDDGYDRSNTFTTDRKMIASKMTQQSYKDRLPPHYILNVKVAIKKTGNQVPKDSQEAWACLNKISSSSSIEERILARIAYLIANAALMGHKDNISLPAP